LKFSPADFLPAEGSAGQDAHYRGSILCVKLYLKYF
jgi:hypothetical protein